MGNNVKGNIDFLKDAVLWDKGNTASAFDVGKTFNHHWGRTINNGDNSLFSSLMQMYNPMYFNKEYAAEYGHKCCVVAPMLVFNVVLGLSVEDLSLRGPFLGIKDCTFHQVVYEGDTLSSRSTVIEKRDSERKNATIVTWKTEGFNQRGELVIDFVRSNLFMG